jgi:hypothetical protein
VHSIAIHCGNCGAYNSTDGLEADSPSTAWLDET